MSGDAGLETRLAAWLSEILGRRLPPTDLDIASPTAGGWSNETHLVRGADVAVVVRVQPERASMFPRYDLERQLWCLERLGAEPEVPTPAVLGVDLTGERLGRPAFAMELLDGRIPADDTPTFAEAGWLRDASSTEQRRFHLGLLRAIASVHAVAVDDAGQALLSPAAGATRSGALDDLREIWEFDQGALTPPGIEQAFADLAGDLDGVESAADPVLLWGDARPANVVVTSNGFDPIGLLDWELASMGPPELDVIWLEEMNWLRVEGAGLPLLPGFVPADEAVKYYESVTGRRLANLEWHRRFAALRVAVLMHRYLRALVHAGQLDAGHKLFGSTVASRRLATLSG